MATVAMSPAKMRTVKGHNNAITLGLVIVRCQPVEFTIHGNVPGIAHTAGNDFQLGTHRSAAQHASLPTPIVDRIVVRFSVRLRRKCPRRGNVRDAGRMRNVPEFTERPRRHTPVLFRLVMTFRITFGHIQAAVRTPDQAVQGVLMVPQIGVHHHVLIGHIIAVKIAHHGQLRGVGDVEIAPFPGHSLDAVEPGGEHFAFIRDAIVIGIQQQDDAIGFLNGLGEMVLRSLPHQNATLCIETERSRLIEQRLGRKNRDRKTRRNLW